MKIVVAYSGGLYTSVILHWLKATYRCEVVAFCADTVLWGPTAGDPRLVAAVRAAGEHVDRFIQEHS